MEGFLKFPSDEIWQLLATLEPETPAVWGIMSAQNMVEHLLLPLKIAQGELKVAVVTPADKVERVKQIMLLGPSPLKKGFAAPFLPEGQLPLQFENLQSAILKLKEEVSSFVDFYETYQGQVIAHPVFGPLNKEEWYLFQSKHFTHHFAQFGLASGS
jgi:hypothetical protein